MIDEKKYEGHTTGDGDSQTWCWSKWMLKNAETVAQFNATSSLLNDAPLLLEEVKRLRERIDYLESIAEEYRQERPEEYCANCYAYISEYDGDGVKECLCSDCEEVIE